MRDLCILLCVVKLCINYLFVPEIIQIEKKRKICKTNDICMNQIKNMAIYISSAVVVSIDI